MTPFWAEGTEHAMLVSNYLVTGSAIAVAVPTTLLYLVTRADRNERKEQLKHEEKVLSTETEDRQDERKVSSEEHQDDHELILTLMHEAFVREGLVQEGPEGGKHVQAD